MAKSTIQGLTVQIGADTGKFVKAMRELDNEAKNIAKNLKTVNENLKLDPSNSKKTAESLKLLQEQAAKASEKVKLIKDAIDKLNKEYDSGKVDVDDYNKSMKNLTNLLSQAEAEQDLANEKVRQFGESADNAADKAKSLGQAILDFATSQPVKAGLQTVVNLAKSIAKHLIEAARELINYSKDAVSVAAQYQDALGYSEKVYGEYAEKITQWVKDNSANLRIGISDLQVYANNLGTAFSALGLGHDQMVEFTENIISLSADIRAATGKDIDEIVNALTRGFTSSTRNLRQFGLFVGEADIKIQALKDGIVEFTGDQDALNKAMEKYAEAAKAAEEAMKSYGEESEQFAAAEAAANEAQEELNALLGEQEVALTSSQRTTALYNLIIERMSFLVGQNAEEAGLYNSQLALMKTTFANLKLEIGERLLPVFTELITKFNEFLQSDEGQEILNAIADAFENIALKIQEMLEDGSLTEVINLIIEKAPQIISDLGEMIAKATELAPLVLDITERLLGLFGLKTEAEASREAFFEHRKEIEELAKSYDTTTETITTAIAAFAEENGESLSTILSNWEFYAPQINNYLDGVKQSYTDDCSKMWEVISDFAYNNGVSVKEICQNWETYEPKIVQYASDMGTDYEDSFNKSLESFSNFAAENGTDLSTVLTDWQNFNIDTVDAYNQYVANTASMEDAVIQEVQNLGPDTQNAIDTAVASVNLSAWDTFWQGIKKTAQDVWSFIKTALSPSAWDNSGFFISGTPHALGGRVQSGMPYLVGDDAQHRPEIFVPDQNGEIISGDKTERILNNVNNSRTVGNVNIYVNSYGMNVAEVADELGAAMNRKLRMSGAIL